MRKQNPNSKSLGVYPQIPVRKLSLPLLVLVTFVTLLFGLWPLNFFPENRVRWLGEQDGIQFYKPRGSSRQAHGGVVYSDAPLDVPARQQVFEPCTIEIYLESHAKRGGGLSHIVSFHDGYPRSPLIVAQWRSYLTIRSRDNENPAKDTYREIGLKDGLVPNEKKLITIASGPDRTGIYVNGELARSYDVQSLIGVEHFCGYLNLGNSSIGHNAWTGNLYGLALYDRLLTPEQIRQHHKLWVDKRRDMPAVIEPEPLILYTFAERAGALIHNQAANKNHLNIPPAFKALRKEIAMRFWQDTNWDIGFARDVLVNILGFIPFSYCLLVFLAGGGRMSARQAAFMTVPAAAVLSLIIEITQLALPTRTPSLLDVLCNTAGAALGILAFRIATRARPTLRFS